MPSLYILKSVCAFLIVFIHLPGFGYEAIVLQPLLRVGVPAFLMISGYFLVSGNNQLDISKVSRQLRKVVTLTILVYIVYIMFHIFRNIILGRPAINPDWLNIDFILRMLFVGDNIDSILWYMTAYIEALLIMWILLRLFSENKVRIILAIVFPILLISAIILNRYSFLFGRTFDIAISRNALTVALPCIYLGILVRTYQERIKQTNQINILLITCLVLAYVEYALLHIYDINGSGADFNIMTFPLAFMVFLYCVLRPQGEFIPKYIRNLLVKTGKNNSADIYLYHSLTWLILALIIYISNNNLIRFMANAEMVILIVLLFSSLKNSIKRKIWILAK